MSVEDLEYVERVTGVSLDEDKPLSNIKMHQGRKDNRKEASGSGAGVSIEKKPEYDWFGFFLSCDVAVGLCERYAQTFNRDSMDESVLPDVDATVLRTLGIREGDIIKIMRFLDKKYGRVGGKRSVSYGGEESMSTEGDSGGLFSGPGGTLRNNTRKGRPAPAVQTNDVVDPKAFSQEPKSTRSEALVTPTSSVPTPAPIQKGRGGNGFDDDAWDVKPSKQLQSQPTSSQPAQTTSANASTHGSQQTLTGSLQDLSLLSQPLQPVKAQPSVPPPTSAAEPAPQQQVQTQQAQQQPPQVTPTFFQGIGQQQTGIAQQQQNLAPNQFQQAGLPQNIARQRPAPPPQFQSQNSALMVPAPPSRPLSAPQVNQNSAFAVPPLQAQNTGMPSSSFQHQIAPPGQSLDDMRLQQQFTNFNNTQNPQNMGMMPQPTGFQQFNGMQQPVQQQPTGFQYPMQTGMQQQPFMNNGGSPFTDPRTNQFSPISQQPTGFQSSFGPPAPQQFPQQTGVNTFLPPALQPTPTGMQSQTNNYTSFSPPPMPPMPQQNTAMPLIPQKTGPPPPVRFGVSADAKKLMPQPTGRRANLSQASKFIPLIPTKQC